jgi:3-oxoacyl-[acyl-carrier-protein] synthase-1
LYHSCDSNAAAGSGILHTFRGFRSDESLKTNTEISAIRGRWMRIVVSACTATSAAGKGLAELRRSIVERNSGLRHNDLDDCAIDTWIGRVSGLEDTNLPARFRNLDSRNNRLAWMGLQQDGFLTSLQKVVDRVGSSRVGVVMGTSTSSIGRTEEAYASLEASGTMAQNYRQPGVHNLHSPGIFVAAATGLEGPSVTISTACSSSAKVFATASRWIRHDVADAVLVGGVDSLCLSTLYGFNSLQLVSASQCRPFDVQRDGINIGEAAGFAVLAREELAPDAEFLLLGYGESSDAWHMSHPHPEGTGALLAIDRALQCSRLEARDIDYINMHGTASRANDLSETCALAERFPQRTSASSSKGWTGHTLGAAGILEAVITLDAMKQGLVPGTLNCETPDPEFRFPVLKENLRRSLWYAMTSSFGFGGNNAVLIFGRAGE